MALKNNTRRRDHDRVIIPLQPRRTRTNHSGCTTGDHAGSPRVGETRPLERRRAAWSQRDDGQTQRARRTQGQVGQSTGQATRVATDRRAGDGVGASGAQAPSRAQEGAQIGSTGVTRQRGLQNVNAQVQQRGEVYVTYDLLRQAQQAHPTNQLTFQIGRQTLTAGQLLQQLNQNPDRFNDFLRANGVSPAEFNELLDDVISSTPAAGTNFDLRNGSELASAYSIGGPNGAVVDNHLDDSAVRRQAAANPNAAQRVDVSNEQVEGPSFWQMVADAFAELAGGIARLFGSSWNPDTVTFNGRVDDEHFQDVGRRMAQGDNGLALQALLARPDGESVLRERLMAQKPESATDAQWTRAVDNMIRGAREGISQNSSLPANLSRQESAQVALYLRANNNSAQAQADVQRVLAQPAAIRGQALQLLNQLPAAQRSNMLALMGPVPQLGANPTPAQERGERVISSYRDATDAQKAAIFETMRRDGFRADVSSHQVDDLAFYATSTHGIPENLQQRYLSLLPQVGMSRLHLVGDMQHGLAARLRSLPAADAAQLMTRAEQATGSTEQMQRLLGAGAFRLRLTEPNGGLITRSADQSAIVQNFGMSNTRLRFTPPNGDPVVISAQGAGAGEVSLQRYFNDAAYRQQVLTRMGGMNRQSFERMLRNVSGSLDSSANGAAVQRQTQTIAQLRQESIDPNASAEDRADAANRLRAAELELATLRAPMNLELDISSGSRLNTLFNLSGAAGQPSARHQLAQERFMAQSDGLDVNVTLRGRRGSSHTISFSDMRSLISNPPSGQTAKQAFEARYPGLDFEETVAAFAQVGQMVSNGDLGDFSSTTNVDLTQRSSNRTLNRIRSRLRDRRDDNVSAGTPFSVDVHARSTSQATDTSRLVHDASVSAAAGNNWFQYGVFQLNGGYGSSRQVHSQARTAYLAAGSQPNISHALNAVFGLDSYSDTSNIAGHGRLRESGVAHGQAARVLTDPRTGATSRPQDFQVLTFSGRGSASHRRAFWQTSDRMANVFTQFGGVPQAQVETHHNVSPEQLFRAVQGEILRDPRAAGDRQDANGSPQRRTVVVHFAGHTISNRANDQVLGFSMTDANGNRAYFTPQQMAQLNRLAQENNVNLVWATDACRAGEYVHQARQTNTAALQAAGTLPQEVQNLNTLRDGLRIRHMTLFAMRRRGRQPAPMPTWQTANRMGAQALQGGAGSQQLRDLQALRDRVNADPNQSRENKYLLNAYVQGIEQTIAGRDGLQGVAGLDPAILSDGLVTGRTAWRSGRRFMTQTQGPLADRINTELRNRTPPPPTVPEHSPDAQ